MTLLSPTAVPVGDFSGLCETCKMSYCAVVAQAGCQLPVYCDLDMSLSNLLLTAAVPGMQ